MALIKCPECGKEVSNKAAVCPVCGFPIAQERSKGKIQMKLGMYDGIGGTQAVTITANGKTIWMGNSGQIAQFELREKTFIIIKYALNSAHYGGTCEGYIDPDRGNKYAVSIRQGMYKSFLTCQMVDMID